MTSLEEERRKEVPGLVPIFQKIQELSFEERDHCLYLKQGQVATPRQLKVGVVFSGGPAPGGNNVIIGLFEALKKIHPTSTLIGFLGGPSGILENQFFIITEEMCKKKLNQGGFDFLGTGRTKIEKEADFSAALKTVIANDLDGLVFIGGDDTNTNAFHLSQFFQKKQCKTVIVGIPKTIDGDLKTKWVEASFGFDTACKVYSEMIGNICMDAKSSLKYWHYIKLMGRKASHVTLECALQTHPNLAFIGEEVEEEKYSLDKIVEEIANLVEKRKSVGKNHGIVLIPEGLIEFIPEIKKLVQELNRLLIKGEGVASLSSELKKLFDSFPKEFQEGLLGDRDPHGNVQVAKIETEKLLSSMVEKRLGINGHPTQHHYLGYEGRCAFPSHFDVTYTFNLGYLAALLIREQKTGYMAAIKGLARDIADWKPIGVFLETMMALEERKGEMRQVIAKSLVDLEAPPFKQFAKNRDHWKMVDDYCSPGPIQFSGVLKDLRTKTLYLESPVQKQ